MKVNLSGGPRRAWIASLSVALLMSGCSDDEPGKSPAGSTKPVVVMAVPVLEQGPADMHALVPADSLVFVQAVSLEALTKASSVYMQLIDPRNAIDDPRELLAGLHLFDPSRVDTTRPCALAVGSPDDEFPMTIIVASKDADALRNTAAPGIGVNSQGDYVAFSPFADPGPLGSPLTADLPAGTVAGRLDLPPLMDAARPAFEMAMGFGQMQMGNQPMPAGMDMQKALEGTKQMMRGVMEAVESLTFSIGQDGREVAFRGALTVKQGSPLGGFSAPEGGNLADLASRVDADAAIQVLMRADIGQLMDRSEDIMRTMMAAYFQPGDQGMDVDEMMGAWSALYRLGVGTVAGSFSLGLPSHMGFYILEAANPEALVDTYERLVEEGMMNLAYSQMQLESRSEVNGVPVTTFLTRLDMDQLYGDAPDAQMRQQMQSTMKMMGVTSDGMLSHFLWAGDRVGMVFGAQDKSVDPEVASAMTRPATALSPALAGMVDELNSHQLGVAIRMDMLGYFRSVVAMMDPSALDVRPGAYTGTGMWTMTAAVTDDTWDLECSLDLGGLLKGFPSMGSVSSGR